MPKGLELHPVVYVSWEDAKAYADWLGMRLPTEAEWEYACRAGSEAEYYFGDNESKVAEYAWYHANSGGNAHPVGEKKPNAWRLYDMHGNVWEWCQDWYDAYASSPAADPKGPSSGGSRVLRGGSWFYYAGLCRSAYRGGRWPSYRDDNTGFRLSRSSE